MNTIKERPILFSAPMVRAILDGGKKQTRRVIKPQPQIHYFCDELSVPALEGKFVRNGMLAVGCHIANQSTHYVNCPHGNKGDRLWVRETGWERPERTPKMMREGADTWKPYYYDADGYCDSDNDQFKEWGFKRRPSIYMPRWASRINLEITGIRVERLQDISEDDCLAEGSENSNLPGIIRGKYKQLWESINGVGSWDANPWVWVIEFNK